MIIDTKTIKSGEAAVFMKDETGKLHVFKGGVIDSTVVRKGTQQVGIMGQVEKYDGIVDLSLSLTEKV